jgi:hypothetical protein
MNSESVQTSESFVFLDGNSIINNHNQYESNDQYIEHVHNQNYNQNYNHNQNQYNDNQ